MEQAVKQRLVGAAVLTALAVIALPLMFDIERPAPIRVTEEMPARPGVPAIQHVEPKPVEPKPVEPKPVEPESGPEAEPTAAGPAEQPVPVSSMYALEGEAVPVPPPVPADQAVTTLPAPAAQSTAATPVPPVPPAPGGKLDAKGVPEAWVVQVAAMSDQAKADIMIKQLKAKGFTAFSVAGKTSKGSAVRVFIGPKLDKAAAIKVKQSVDHAMGLQTMVVPYSVR